MSLDSPARILYVSRAMEGLDEAAISDIVKVSRRFNEAHGVTGLLLYSGTHFAQVLEGADSVLESLMESIRRDTRHSDVRTLLEQPMERRDFEGWAMAFVQEHGVSDLLESLWAAPRVSASRAQRLVASVFRRLPPRAGS